MKIDFKNTQVAFRSKTNGDLKRSYLLFELLNYPELVNLGAGATRIALSLHLPIGPLIRATIFRQFCGGETLEESYEKALELSKYGVGTILDVAVEGSQTEQTFEITTKEILRTIDLSGKHQDFLPFSVFKMTGIASFELLEKIQKKTQLTPEEEKQWHRAKERVQRICQACYSKGVRLLVDAEETWIHDRIDALATEMMEKFNKEKPIIYNTVQMYRKDRLDYLKESLEKAKAGKYILAVKVVRGAYLEKERNHARATGVPSPLYETKEQTDDAYNQAMDFCIGNIEHMAVVAGTHNEYSTQHLINLMEEKKIPAKDPRIFFSQLFGMSDHLSFQLAERGYHVAKYLPYGEVRVLLPYLIRRAQENTAIHGQTPRELSLIKQELQRRKKGSLSLPATQD